MAVRLYISRHEEAEPGHAVRDGHRVLTGFGRRRGRQTGRLLVERPEIIDTVWASPLVRAVQTAEIFAGALGIEDSVAVKEIIAEPPSVDMLIDVLLDVPAHVQGLLMVGHQPTLGVLISTLIGREYRRSLRPGTVVALTVDRATKRASPRWAIEGICPAVIEDLEMTS